MDMGYYIYEEYQKIKKANPELEEYQIKNLLMKQFDKELSKLGTNGCIAIQLLENWIHAQKYFSIENFINVRLPRQIRKDASNIYGE